MEVNKVYVKKRTEFGKQCIFDLYGPIIDLEITPNTYDRNDYLMRTHCHIGSQYSKQLALHQAQTMGTTSKNTGMFHFEGGWPKEINPRDEETVLRYRRRVEKDDNWAPRLRPLLKMMEEGILQNGAVNIYQHYFDDMIPTPLVQHLGIRTTNVYADPETPARPVTNISWSPDSGSRIVVSYCFLKFGRVPDYSNRAYIWQVDNPIEPYMALKPFCPCVVCEFNSRDPSVLASGLMTGQVCSWDIRTGTSPVQSSHLQFSHRECVNGVKWIPTKSNTEFFSTSTDGRAMWWDTRWLQKPTEVLMFDLENPNEPDIDMAIGVSSLNFGPMVGTKFMFGMDNGVILTGSRKAKTNAEKLAVRFPAHFGPVVSVDRNVFNPAVFLSVGDWTARIWAEDTREGNLISTMFLTDHPTGACWNKLRQSVFYVITSAGRLLVWDLLQSFRQPIFTLQLCNEGLTALAPHEDGSFLSIGTSNGKVFLVESTEFLQVFDRKDRGVFSEFLDKCSKLTKAVDVRLREIKLTQKITAEEEQDAVSVVDSMKSRVKQKKKRKSDAKEKDQGKEYKRGGGKERKRVRDELPEMVEAEQKYYETVEKEMNKYEMEGDPDICPVRQTHGPSKKQDRKRRKSQDVEQDAKKIELKDGKKGSKHKKSSPGSSAERQQRSFKSSMRSVESTPKIPEPSSAHLLAEDISRKFGSRMLIRGEKKKQKPKIKFFLPIPCKGEVCRPKVCCWRTGKRQKKRERKASEDVATVIDQSSLMLPKGAKKSSSMLSEMLRPPVELRYEVERAKREIREATWSVGERKRYISRRTKRRRSKRVVLKVREDRDEESEERTLEDEEEGKKEEVIVDPCSPMKAKDTVEEFSAILGVPVPQLVEEEVEGKHYSEELEAARGRVYPRISEFRSLE